MHREASSFDSYDEVTEPSLPPARSKCDMGFLWMELQRHELTPTALPLVSHLLCAGRRQQRCGCTQRCGCAQRC
eukprot:3291194-Prymnesium_polylepis.1